MTRALVVVDVQNDFCEGGGLGVRGGGEVAARITAALRSSPGRWDLVVATQDWHVDPGRHFASGEEPPDFAETWPVHCVAGTWGAQFHPNLDLPAGTVVVRKGAHEAAYSGFEGHDPAGRPLAGILDAAGVTQVEVVGLATSFCDLATALDAQAHGYATSMLLDLCADVDPALTPGTLERLAAAGVTVAHLDEGHLPRQGSP